MRTPSPEKDSLFRPTVHEKIVYQTFEKGGFFLPHPLPGNQLDRIVYLQPDFLQQSFLQQVFAKVLHKKKYFCNHMLYTYWVSIIVIFARSLCKSSTQIEVFLQPYVVYRDASYTGYKLSPSCLKIFTITLITRITNTFIRSQGYWALVFCFDPTCF